MPKKNEKTLTTKSECLKDLEKNYENPAHPISYSGISTIKDFYKGVLNEDDIRKFLSKNHTYTIFKQNKKPKTNPYYVYYKRQMMQSDLIEISSVSKYNSNNKFILTVIDVWTRMAFARLLKSKSGAEVVKGFESILQEAGSPPSIIVTDRG